MRLLLTGATGLVGRCVLAEAVGRGVETHATTSSEDRARTAGLDGVSWHVADLTAPGAASALVRQVRPTHVIHAAWDTRHTVYWNSLENLAWVAATAEMALAFAESGGQRFVLVGTCAEYDWSHGYMVEGVTPENPSTVYGSSKLAAHIALTGAAAKLDFSAVTARIFFSFGPYENFRRLVPYICRTLAAGETPNLSGGRQLRDLLHSRDTARALMALADDTTLKGAVNIGSGQPVTLAEVARILAACAGRPGQTGLGRLPDRPDDPIVLLPSTARLFSTGWRPQGDLESGLAETYAWWARAPITEQET